MIVASWWPVALSSTLETWASAVISWKCSGSCTKVCSLAWSSLERLRSLWLHLHSITGTLALDSASSSPVCLSHVPTVICELQYCVFSTTH